MKIRCLIVDDKPLAIDILAEYVNKVPFLELAGYTTNPVEGLSLLRTQHIQLVFLDIQMPELTGLQFIKIAGRQCKIILTTAYAEYALEGYEHDVIDYLLKPVSFERFYRAAEKALVHFQPAFAPVVPPVSPVLQQDRPEFLFIKTEHRILKVSLSEILYIESMQNYVALYTTLGKIISLQTLKKLEEQLPAAEFVRVSKSFIVSLRHISSIERSRIFIDKAVIPIGDAYRDAFYRLIQ